MSAPTKIYLFVVAILVIAWAGVSTFVAAKGPGLYHVTDPEELLYYSDRFSAMLRGRVDIRDAEGRAVAPPEGTLMVDVQARDAEGSLAVSRIGSVQADGVFEVLGLPHGIATVSVQLGGGQTIWQCEDIVVGGAGTLDPRIDPIDLKGDLFSFDVAVRGPSGAPADRGQIAWRQVGAEDVVTFDGLAPIGEDGQARFLSTSSILDVVCLVPGARTQLFEEVYPDSELDLGIGITVDITAEGTLPNPERWAVHAALVPIELEPRIELRAGFDHQGGDATYAPSYAELDPQSGLASVPVTRGGRYQLTWSVLPVKRRRINTINLKDPEEIIVPSVPGTYPVVRPFPIEAFLRKEPGG